MRDGRRRDEKDERVRGRVQAQKGTTSAPGVIFGISRSRTAYGSRSGTGGAGSGPFGTGPFDAVTGGPLAVPTGA